MNETSFKNTVIQYCETDDKIKEHNKMIKDLKLTQKDLSEVIMDYMSNKSLEVCKVGEYGVLTLKTTVSKSPLNVDTIRDNLSRMMTDTDIMNKTPDVIANEGAEYIVNNRETTEKKSLRRNMLKK
tara:strand:+ start:153 stop:530 length:378 start_codon:yes stop_codon:yes gene_type:complete